MVGGGGVPRPLGLGTRRGLPSVRRQGPAAALPQNYSRFVVPFPHPLLQTFSRGRLQFCRHKNRLWRPEADPDRRRAGGYMSTWLQMPKEGWRRRDKAGRPRPRMSPGVPAAPETTPAPGSLYLSSEVLEPLWSATAFRNAAIRALPLSGSNPASASASRMPSGMTCLPASTIRLSCSATICSTLPS